MIYVGVVVITVFYSFFLMYCRKLFPPTTRRLVPLLASVFGIVSLYLILAYWDIHWINLPCITLVLTAAVRYSTGMTWQQALCGGSSCVVSVYCFRGMFTSAYAVMALRSNQDMLFRPEVYYTSTLIILPLLMIYFAVFRRTIFSDNKLKRFLSNREQMKFVIAYEVSTILEFTVVNQGRFELSNPLWYAGVMFGVCALNFSALVYLMHHAIQTIELVEYKWHAKILEEQNARQLRHYKSFQQYTNRFRAFQHDYKSMIGSLKHMIAAQENDKALQLIDNMNITMEQKILVQKRYSDFIVLDSIVQDLAATCEENNIRFSFQATANIEPALSLLDSIRVFSNLTNNAVEACCQVLVSERFIDMVSSHREGWHTLQIINSFNGKVRMRGDSFLTTHVDKQNRGLGLGIVKDIVDSAGGFLICQSDLKNNTFQVQVHVPDQ